MFAPVSRMHLCTNAALHGCPWSFLTLNTCRKWNFILNTGACWGRAWAGVTRLGDFGGELGGVTLLTEQREQIRISDCKCRPPGARLLGPGCRNKLRSLLTAALLGANFFLVADTISTATAYHQPTWLIILSSSPGFVRQLCQRQPQACEAPYFPLMPQNRVQGWPKSRPELHGHVLAPFGVCDWEEPRLWPSIPALRLGSSEIRAPHIPGLGALGGDGTRGSRVTST